jgi:hypothetical protein
VIVFETALEEIRATLLQIIRNIIESTQSLSRPENGLARSEKSFLWAVPFEDLLVQQIYSEIDGIIQDNMAYV